MNPGERRDLSKRPFINNNPEETDVSAKEFNAAVRNAEQGVADTTPAAARPLVLRLAPDRGAIGHGFAEGARHIGLGGVWYLRVERRDLRPQAGNLRTIGLVDKANWTLIGLVEFRGTAVSMA